MCRRRRLGWCLLGLVAGGLLGAALVAGGTHGWAGGTDERWESHQSFLSVKLFDTAGTRAEVEAVERRWSARLYPAAVLVGALTGLAIALGRARRRTGPPPGIVVAAWGPWTGGRRVDLASGGGDGSRDVVLGRGERDAIG